MRDRLPDVVERAELSVASCSGVLSEESLGTIIDRLKAIRIRLSYPDDVLVVALAGGTGSGKSSLFNAMAGDDLVAAGGIRPTTSEPAVAVPLSARSSLDGYLDSLGIHIRHAYDGPRVCLIDLPDTDSVMVEHRHSVDRVVPLVDVVIWVTDPEKYRDASLHRDYLAAMTAYSDQFVFVLNQIDKLTEDDRRRVVSDLASALSDDGLTNHRIVAVAAAPVVGPPIGVDEVWTMLETMQSVRDISSDKLLTDLSTTARALVAETGGSVDFDRRAAAATAAAAEHIAVRDQDMATAEMVSFLEAVSEEVGGLTGDKVARLAADVPAHMLRIASEVEPPPQRRRWLRKKHQEVPDFDVARSLLAAVVIRPVRAVLAKRAVALASMTDLALEVESLRCTPAR